MTLIEMARESGRSGEKWLDFTFRDDVGALCESSDNNIEAALTAWEEGERERRIANGWVTLWTTAPADYDTFGTETVDSAGEWFGRELRKVIAHPHHADYQRDRYGSGLHGSWTEDPRVAQAEEKAKRERWAREDAERSEARTAALARLKAMTDADLIALDDYDESHGLGYQDIRDERREREKAVEEARMKAEWDRCAALVPEGCTILDNGTKGYRGVYGYVKGCDTHVYYRCKIVPHYLPSKAGDPDEATVTGEGRMDGPSLLITANRVTEGRYEIVTPEEVPPQKVVDRIGHELVKKIKRYEVCGRVVWVGRKSFDPALVLDENGRIVRAKKVLNALADLNAFVWT